MIGENISSLFTSYQKTEVPTHLSHPHHLFTYSQYWASRYPYHSNTPSGQYGGLDYCPSSPQSLFEEPPLHKTPFFDELETWIKEKTFYNPLTVDRKSQHHS